MIIKERITQQQKDLGLGQAMIAHNETVSICKMTEPVTNEPNPIIYTATGQHGTPPLYSKTG